jgi:hypothetical protein
MFKLITSKIEVTVDIAGILRALTFFVSCLIIL